eukprot:CAMPEP_0179368542 /NCGR_PEP_ID=MMETSP0797-20121207/84153_1 /TAXON_ID=47934 /ORGANISM="Dinophysis acuminata, Strain DAEP01" /LENGTH=99 /DNA_ID=CAMNT_0021084145 /DNA_START=36 /DNA_END=332 /DNA_ORIENTATION=-
MAALSHCTSRSTRFSFFSIRPALLTTCRSKPCASTLRYWMSRASSHSSITRSSEMQGTVRSSAAVAQDFTTQSGHMPLFGSLANASPRGFSSELHPSTG